MRVPVAGLAILGVLASGCAGVRTEIVVGSDYLKLGLPARDPGEVQVLLDAPTSPYVTLAIIRAEAGTYERAVGGLKELAAALGADAITDIRFYEDYSYSTGWHASYGRGFAGGIHYVEPSTYSVVHGRAIAFEPLPEPGEAEPAGVTSDPAAPEDE